MFEYNLLTNIVCETYFVCLPITCTVYDNIINYNKHIMIMKEWLKLIGQ